MSMNRRRFDELPLDKIMDVYIAKTDYATPSEAHANLSLPAMPFELFDALDRARIQQGDELYFQVEEYYAFENMEPFISDAVTGAEYFVPEALRAERSAEHGF